MREIAGRLHRILMRGGTITVITVDIMCPWLDSELMEKWAHAPNLATCRQMRQEAPLRAHLHSPGTSGHCSVGAKALCGRGCESSHVQTSSPPRPVSWAGYVAPTPPRWRARSSPAGPRPCLPPACQSGCPTPAQPGWTWTPRRTALVTPTPLKQKEEQALQFCGWGPAHHAHTTFCWHILKKTKTYSGPHAQSQEHRGG